MPDTIILSPIGAESVVHVDWIGEEIAEIFRLPTRSLTLLQDMDFSLDPLRGQYHSTAVLSRLAELAPPWGFKILGVTGLDLFIPILTHVYGEAQLAGKACIVSTRRLREGAAGGPAELLRTRLLKEATHELGHTFGLRHCPDERCVMHYCRRIGHVDRKSMEFCRYCRVMLEDAISASGIEHETA